MPSSTSPQPTSSTPSATPSPPSESPWYFTGNSKSKSPPRVQILLLPSPPTSSPPSKLDQLPLRPLTILRSIQTFIVSTEFRDGLSNLILSPVDPKGFEALQRELFRPQILSCEQVDKLRYDYCPESFALTILAMPTPPHDSITSYAPECLSTMRETQFLTRNERSCLMADTGGDVSLPTMSSLSSKQGKSKGSSTAMKQPDAAYYLTPRVSPARLRCFPRVVFEVAYSQSYESLREDARHWLLRGQGSIKLVVAVKLSEGIHAKAESDSAEVEQKELEQRAALDLPVGGDNGHQDLDTPTISPRTHSPASNASPASAALTVQQVASPTAEDHENWFEDDPAPWVGPITGFIELYRYDSESKTMYQDGPRYDLFPALPADTVEPDDELPHIRITDLLPSTHIEGDNTRTFPLPLDLYRSLIDDGVRKLARNRRAREYQTLRKRQRDDVEDDCFKPGPSEPEALELEAGGDGPRRSKRNRVQR